MVEGTSLRGGGMATPHNSRPPRSTGRCRARHLVDNVLISLELGPDTYNMKVMSGSLDGLRYRGYVGLLMI